ncbi:hypothetical protein SUDANB58_00008 [Streptomyces sp. enrichment culture]|uniref:hypothetical protein n=1 Tax=Streptomyces sp. enrichment culture TaxID=1795815 RepID=UPI003F55F6E1
MARERERIFAASHSGRTIADLPPCASAGVTTPATLDRLATERDLIAERAQDLTRAMTGLDRVVELSSRRAW